MADLDDEVFVGRHAELNNLRTALDQARQGFPQIVVLEGPGGIGKTTLLDRFLHQESDLTVLRVSGEEWEKLLPYALLDQLARVAGNVGLLLPGADASAAEEPITVGTRLRGLWSELQDERVVVTVIDDAHWADLDSLRAMLFAMRRLITDRVLVIVALRDLNSSAVEATKGMITASLLSWQANWGPSRYRRGPLNVCIDTPKATPCTCGP